MTCHRVSLIMCLAGLLACGTAESSPADDGGAGPSASTAGSGGSSTGGAGGSGKAGSGVGGDGGGDSGTVEAGSPDAPPDSPSTCKAGTMLSLVRFHVAVANGADYCTDRCRGLWVSVVPAAGGEPLAISQNFCKATCGQCLPIACSDSGCPPPNHLPPEGDTFTWSGALWEASTCGSNMLSCDERLCTPPGKYVARMCANRATADAGDAGATADAGRSICTTEPTPTCVDVPFDYPTSATVEGVLP